MISFVRDHQLSLAATAAGLTLCAASFAFVEDARKWAHDFFMGFGTGILGAVPIILWNNRLRERGSKDGRD